MTDAVRVGKTLHALSPWQAASIRPWEEGVYARTSPAGPYACWNGSAWMLDARTPRAAARQTRPSTRPLAPWRGLAKPSGGPCLTCKGHTLVDRGFDPESLDDLIAECPDC